MNRRIAGWIAYGKICAAVFVSGTFEPGEALQWPLPR